MKNLFILLLLIPISLFAGRNPIMVINCAALDAANVSTRNNLVATMTPCPIGPPPEGTICVGGYLVPDCAAIQSCIDEGCTNFQWNDIAKQCECYNADCGADDPFDCIDYYGCGCPPGFEEQIDGSCIIPDKNCYDGTFTFTVGPIVCGSITTPTITQTIIISGINPPGSALNIADLENCELTNGQNFVLALKGVFGDNVAFVDDDNDGMIEIDIIRDPLKATNITWDNGALTPISIAACPSTGYVPPTAAIPTMGEWAIMLLGAGFLVVSFIVFRKFF